MKSSKWVKGYMTDKDLDFLIESTSPEVLDKTRLKQIIMEDEDFRNSFVSDDRVFSRLMNDDKVFLKISPALFFEILLRRAAKELEEAHFTVEKSGFSKVPVFDTHEVVELLAKGPLLKYLAHMLSSFTKVKSYALSFKVKKGVWRKIQFSDLDIHTLMSFSEAVEDNYKINLYKRIADICLFILGMYPEYAERDYRYPFSGQLRPSIRGKLRISPEDYEEKGRKFYKLAAEHESPRNPELADVFWSLHGNFHVATKPLNFISERYLYYTKKKFFND